MDRRTLFIGYCWGAAGTTWLSRLLNSHEDILCLHAPNFPRFGRHDYDDVVTMLRAIYELGAMGGAYRLVGVTHGVPLSWDVRLREEFGECLAGFVLTRHPIVRIRSNTRLHERSQNRTSDDRWRDILDGAYAKLVERSGRRHFPDDFASLGFYNSCAMVNSIVSERASEHPIYRLEDLVADADSVQDLLAHVSQGACPMDTTRIAALQQTVVASHVAKRLSERETYESWTDVQREAYHYLVRPEALEAYARLGYEFPHAV